MPTALWGGSREPMARPHRAKGTVPSRDSSRPRTQPCASSRTAVNAPATMTTAMGMRALKLAVASLTPQ